MTALTIIGIPLLLGCSSRNAIVPAPTAPRTTGVVTASPQPSQARAELKSLGYILANSHNGKEVWKTGKLSPSAPTVTIEAGKLTIIMPDGVSCQAQAVSVTSLLIYTSFEDNHKATTGLSSTPQAGGINSADGTSIATTCWIARLLTQRPLA